ncbi:MAG: hypothetical protein R6V05_02285 [Candidatus Brocadiia bacterium]
MATRTVLLSVGDDSGDLHAANLMRAMQQRRPDLRFVGFGMERMQGAGLEPLDEVRDSAMWMANLLRLGRFRRRLAAARGVLDAGEVDLVLPVDFGGFNLYLCRAATRRGVPVFYYIPPQVWAHGRYRLKKLRKWTTRCGLIYPFEPGLYSEWGVAGDYVGHPLFDEIERNPPSEQVVARLREEHGARLVAVFPGSRRQELKPHLRLVAECRRRLADIEGVGFAVLTTPRWQSYARELLRGEGSEMAVLDGVRPVELARAARVCLTKSGTITLEIASQGTPMVIFYRTSPFLYFLACGLSHSPWAGLINVLAGREVCPERVMAKDHPEWLARHVRRLLTDETAWERCRRDIEGVMEGFARPGASERAAESALRVLGG